MEYNIVIVGTQDTPETVRNILSSIRNDLKDGWNIQRADSSASLIIYILERRLIKGKK